MNKLVWYLRTPLPYRMHRMSVVLVLIITNVVVFFISGILPQEYLMRFLAINPVFFFKSFFVWTPLTYMFTHYDFSHILFNMLGLYFAGVIIERQWGSDEFLVLYLGIGIGSGVLSVIVYYFTGSFLVFLIGASGAVYGVLFIFAVLYPQAQMYVFGIFPVRARILILIFIGIQLLSLRNGIGSQVAYLTHLFGFLFAWLYLYFRHRIDPYRALFPRRWS